MKLTIGAVLVSLALGFYAGRSTAPEVEVVPDEVMQAMNDLLLRAMAAESR